MKNLFTIALIATALSFGAITTAFAGTDEVPVFRGAENFSKSFPKASGISYKTVGNYIEVNFTLEGRECKAFYDAQGNFVGTSRKLSLQELPILVQQKIKAAYPEYVWTELIDFDSVEMGLNYYVSLLGPKKSYVLAVSADGDISVFKMSKNQ